jgi:uncharacterized protein (TIGR02284 family)
MGTTAATRATTGTLNGLIVACNDDIRAHNAAAGATRGERQHTLEDSAQARAVFVRELGQLVRDLGSEPTAGGSMLEGVLGLIASARTMLTGEDHAGDRYTTCGRVEGKTEALYDRALNGSLPDNVRLVVERQRGEISADRDAFRRSWIL